jgi:hypothetical protein
MADIPGLQYLPMFSNAGNGGGQGANNMGSIGSGNSIKTDDRTTSSASNNLSNAWGDFSVNYGSQGLPDWVIAAGAVLAVLVIIKRKRKG